MQHALALRRDCNAFLTVDSQETVRQRPTSQLALRSTSLSSLYLSTTFQESVHGRPYRIRPTLPCGCVRVMSNSSADSSTNGEHSMKNQITKIVKRVLPAAAVAGLMLLAKAGFAFASSQVVMPSVSQSSVLAKSGKDLLVSAWMGLVAGCLHTLTGPDHLAALAPLSVGRSKLESVAVGALWGCGHDAGQVIFGILFLLLKDKLHIEILRTWGARVVGMTLVAIGITGIREAHEAAVIPCLAGDASGFAPNGLQHVDSDSNAKRNTVFATLATGIVHGLQPDALIMILPALALPSRFAGAAFLSMFLLGTVLSMSCYTAFIGSCSTALQKRVPRITEHLAWGSSLLAIFVGIGILAGELFGINIF